MAILVGDVITEIRDDLDEPIEAVWKNRSLVTWLNVGIYQVMRALRGVREDWSTVRIRSTDPAPPIVTGEEYDPVGLKIVAGTDIYTLPSNLVEVRTWEPLNQSDKDAGIQFIPRDIASLDYLSIARSSNTNPVAYLYDLLGTNSVRITPVPTATIETEMFYVKTPTRLDEDAAITEIPAWAIPAAKEYTVYRAHKAINHPDTAKSYSLYTQELADLTSYASPRHTNDPHVVEGIFDEEDMLESDYTY